MYDDLDFVDIDYILYEALHERKKGSFKVRAYSIGSQECIVQCENRSCTSKGFDLSFEVHHAVSSKKEVCGKMLCKGKLDSKYKGSTGQSCDWHIEYVIKPHFKEVR